GVAPGAGAAVGAGRPRDGAAGPRQAQSDLEVRAQAVAGAEDDEVGEPRALHLRNRIVRKRRARDGEAGVEVDRDAAPGTRRGAAGGTRRGAARGIRPVATPGGRLGARPAGRRQHERSGEERARPHGRISRIQSSRISTACRPTSSVPSGGIWTNRSRVEARPITPLAPGSPGAITVPTADW